MLVTIRIYPMIMIIIFLVEFFGVKLVFALVQCFSNCSYAYECLGELVYNANSWTILSDLSRYEVGPMTMNFK